MKRPARHISDEAERTARMARPQANRRRRRLRPRGGFSLIELLMVVAIVGLLVSVLIVALNKVRGTGESASTEQLMRAIDMGLSQFKSDHGFLPPLLDDTISATGSAELVPYALNRVDRIDYYSSLSLAPYLLGVGDLNGDGVQDEYDDGAAGAGFRDPGRDRSWGYTYTSSRGNGRKQYWRDQEKPGRSLGDPKVIPGPTFGPYLAIGGEDRIVYGANRNGQAFTDTRPLFVIADYWGGAIRYYRHWPKVLPPGRTLEGEVPVWFGSLSADQVESFKMQSRSVEYILMSTGPDAKAHDDKVDAEENKDNIVRAQS